MRHSRCFALIASLCCAIGLLIAGGAPARAESLVPSVSVRASQAGVGLRAAVLDGGSSGGDGTGRPIDTLTLDLDGLGVPGDLSFEVCQGGVWSRPAASGETLGERGSAIQAVRMSLTGEAAERYDLVYRADVAAVGWLGWTSDGAAAGAPNVTSIDAVQARLLPKGAPLPADGTSATLGAASLSYFGYRDGQGWEGPVTTGSVGTATVSLLGFRAQLAGASRPGGSIRYAVYRAGGWGSEAADGADACPVDAADPIRAIRISLTGPVADLYDVWYRVHIHDRGWLGCAKNGEPAGSALATLPAEAVQLWLLPKGSSAPEGTGAPFIERFSSGDPELDGIVATILDTVTGRDGIESLRRAFRYVADYPYRYMDVYPTGDWSPAFAKQMFHNHGGNCYRYAALFRELARGLGFKARVVSGEVSTSAEPHAAHGWCEIELDGQVYLFDPDMAHGRSEATFWKFWQRTYDNPPLNYSQIYMRGPW